MSLRNYVDNSPTKKVAGSLTSGATTIALDSLTALPTVYPYTATLGLGTAAAEQILVTGAAGGTSLTITRNYNGQGAFSHPDGETFDHTAIAKDYQESNAHVNASSAVHGVAGLVVGTTDTQTLSSKTLDTPTVTGPAHFTGSPLIDGTVTVGGGAAVTGTVTAGAFNGPGVVPSGAVFPYAGTTAPTGYLICDGSAVSRTTYAPLFAVIGATYGSGDGASTFNVPDMRSRFATGVDTRVVDGTDHDGDGHVDTINGVGALGTRGGSNYHQHVLSDNGQAEVLAGGTSIVSRNVTSGSWTSTQRVTGTNNPSQLVETSGAALTGFTDPIEQRPSYVVFNFIIKS